MHLLHFVVPFASSLNHGWGHHSCGLAKAMLRLSASCVSGAHKFKLNRLSVRRFGSGSAPSLLSPRNFELLTAVLSGVEGNVINGKEHSKVLLAEARDECEELYKYATVFFTARNRARPDLHGSQAIRNPPRSCCGHCRQQKGQSGAFSHDETAETAANTTPAFTKKKITSHTAHRHRRRRRLTARPAAPVPSSWAILAAGWPVRGRGRERPRNNNNHNHNNATMAWTMTKGNWISLPRARRSWPRAAIRRAAEEASRPPY